MVALADWCVECENCAHKACLTTAMFTIGESTSSDLFADISPSPGITIVGGFSLLVLLLLLQLLPLCGVRPK